MRRPNRLRVPASRCVRLLRRILRRFLCVACGRRFVPLHGRFKLSVGRHQVAPHGHGRPVAQLACDHLHRVGFNHVLCTDGGQFEGIGQDPP